MARHPHTPGDGDPLRPSVSAPAGQPADERLQGPGSGVPDTGPAPVDPGLEEDLGAEFAFRGDTLDAELEAARDEAAACRDIALRAQADFDNYRKRMARDQEDSVKRAGERIIGELLPVIDNLERAIDHAIAGGDAEQLLGGLEIVHRQLLDVLAKEGAAPLDPFGAQFDPALHQAIGQREDTEVPDGTVVEVYQKGYEMHGRVIRSAMVVVATGGPAPKE
jgi:molecular chaperone GrpE